MLERSFITKENRLYGEQVVLAWLSGTFYITTHHPFILPTILSQLVKRDSSTYTILSILLV